MSTTFDIQDQDCQDVEIRVQGPALAWCESHVDPALAEAEEVYPDLVRLFAHCANLGMFCGRDIHPSRSGASILQEDFDPSAPSQSWRLHVEGVDPAAFRILRNLFLARGLEAVEMRSLDGRMGRAGSSHPARPYPGIFGSLPFSVDAEPPQLSTCPRSVQIQFHREPADDVLESVYGVLSRWSLLPALGGFAPPDLSPQRSGTIPDLAILLDPTTVEQGFQEIFECDEAAFAAVINWAVGFHDKHPIREICIR